jgi:TFIIF-interacting CTD phosphatase-like protein
MLIGFWTTLIGKEPSPTGCTGSTPHEDYAIKDLAKLGRNLSKTIIIDNLAENFMMTTPANGIWVESWYDDMDDQVLSLLLPFLKEIVIEQADV